MVADPRPRVSTRSGPGRVAWGLRAARSSAEAFLAVPPAARGAGSGRRVAPRVERRARPAVASWSASRQRARRQGPLRRSGCLRRHVTTRVPARRASARGRPAWPRRRIEGCSPRERRVAPAGARSGARPRTPARWETCPPRSSGVRDPRPARGRGGLRGKRRERGRGALHVREGERHGLEVHERRAASNDQRPTTSGGTATGCPSSMTAFVKSICAPPTSCQEKPSSWNST